MLSWGIYFKLKKSSYWIKLYYTFKCGMERVRVANLQSSSHRCRNQGVGWVLIDGLRKSAGGGVYSLN